MIKYLFLLIFLSGCYYEDDDISPNDINLSGRWRLSADTRFVKINDHWSHYDNISDSIVLYKASNLAFDSLYIDSTIWEMTYSDILINNTNKYFIKVDKYYLKIYTDSTARIFQINEHDVNGTILKLQSSIQYYWDSTDNSSEHYDELTFIQY